MLALRRIRRSKFGLGKRWIRHEILRSGACVRQLERARHGSAGGARGQRFSDGQHRRNQPDRPMRWGASPPSCACAARHFRVEVRAKVLMLCGRIEVSVPIRHKLPHTARRPALDGTAVAQPNYRANASQCSRGREDEVHVEGCCRRSPVPGRAKHCSRIAAQRQRSGSRRHGFAALSTPLSSIE